MWRDLVVNLPPPYDSLTADDWRFKCVLLSDLAADMLAPNGTCDVALGAITNTLDRQKAGIKVRWRARFVAACKRARAAARALAACGSAALAAAQPNCVVRAPRAPKLVQFTDVPTTTASLALAVSSKVSTGNAGWFWVQP